MHSGEVQTLRDNHPEEVLAFSVYCDIFRADVAAFSGIVAQGIVQDLSSTLPLL